MTIDNSLQTRLLAVAPDQLQTLRLLYLRTQQILWGNGLKYGQVLITDALKAAALALPENRQSGADASVSAVMKFPRSGLVSVT